MSQLYKKAEKRKIVPQIDLKRAKKRRKMRKNDVFEKFFRKKYCQFENNAYLCIRNR